MDQTTSFLRAAEPSDRAPRPAPENSLAAAIESLAGFVRRQAPMFGFVTGCALVLGLAYLLTAPAKYTSHAMLLIDSSKMRVLQQQQANNDPPLDTAQVESQVEILKSDSIGLSVIKNMHLTEDPEFVGTGNALISWFTDLFSSSPPSTLSIETRLQRKALQRFLKGRTVSRVGKTYVLDIGFTSLSPQQAAAIANEIADAYIVDQLDAKYQATRRASGWLQERLKELRAQASAADRDVLDYKEQNNIVDLGGGFPASADPNNKVFNPNDRLIGEAQLGDLNTQLSAARVSTKEAMARLARIQEVMKREVPDASVTDALRNDVINKLRSEYLELAAKQQIWSEKYGADHMATQNLAAQMAQIRRNVTNELGRIAESYKSDLEIAKSKEFAIEKQLGELVETSQSTNRNRLGLRELESTAHVYHVIYDSFLQRYMEAIQQQSFPITEARVISLAAEPTSKSSPVAPLVLALAGLIGLILSLALATLREAVDRVFRTSRQVETTLETTCLATLPMLGPPQTAPSPLLAIPLLRDLASHPAIRHLPRLPRPAAPPMDAAPAAEPGVRTIASTRQFMRQVIDEPLSGFAEMFRTIKVAADNKALFCEHKVIGVTSTLPKEGKSTISCNLAQLIADSDPGKRTILIDCDLRNPSLTRALAGGATKGLIEVLKGEATLDETTYHDPTTGLTFLPTVIRHRMTHTNEVLASPAMHDLIARLRKEYDYVVIDFPPTAPVVDIRATFRFVDSYIYVVEWGRTRIDLVETQIASAPDMQERLLGVVLNKANVAVLRRYEGYYGRYYYQRYYGAYGTEA